MVKLALIQMACTETAADNLQRALLKIDEAAGLGANIVVLPELFLGPYFCKTKDDKTAFDRAEEIPGQTTEALSAAAKKNGIVLVGSLFEKADKGDKADKGKEAALAGDKTHFYNSAPVFMPDGQMAGVYRKAHIPEDPLYHEQQYFESGGQEMTVFETPFGKMAVMICFDQWFPEFARIAALKGAEILVYPTAIGTLDESVEPNITGDWQNMWTAAQLGHAAVNTVYVAAVNRVGREGAMDFWGGSFIADPSAKILARGGRGEEIVIAEIQPERVSALQKTWNFFSCRQPKLYKRLSE